ncbi:hypothetical protein [Amycolatopsis sp. lyj-23]|uniref:hypothetical protein n=1 Tax=Amycolatopsis sp. lyj-23 TaxID=2789283 RepID=UPI00397C7BBE
MANRHGDQVDQAAVLGVVLAAAVSISAAEGPWEPIESIVGLVLLLLVKAFVDTAQAVGPARRAQRLALAAVIGLGAVLMASWPLQKLLCLLNWGGALKWMLVVVWIAVFVGYALLRRHGLWPLRRFGAVVRWL